VVNRRLDVVTDEEKTRRAPRRDDGKPGSRPARTRRPEGQAAAPAVPNATAPAPAKRVRAKKPDGVAAAPTEKAGE
jgi:small subunit ribosomal protein S3